MGAWLLWEESSRQLLHPPRPQTNMGGSAALMAPWHQGTSLKLKPAMKAKWKSTQYWSTFSIFFIVGGNYSHVVANDILVESCRLMELAFSERRPKEAAVGTGTRGRGCRKAWRQVFLRAHKLNDWKWICLCKPIICTAVPALNNPSLPKEKYSRLKP